LRTVPRTERPDEADHHTSVESVACPNRGAIDVRTITIRVDAVWVDEQGPRRDAPRDDLVPHRAADHHDQSGRRQIELFDSSRERLVLERMPPVAAHPDL